MKWSSTGYPIGSKFLLPILFYAPGKIHRVASLHLTIARAQIVKTSIPLRNVFGTGGKRRVLPFSKTSVRRRRGSNPHDRFNLETQKLYEQQEIVDPVRIIEPNIRCRYFMPLTRIPQEQWPDVAQRNANGESLRQLAKCYGVSHEAVRQVLRR